MRSQGTHGLAGELKLWCTFVVVTKEKANKVGQGPFHWIFNNMIKCVK